MSTDREDNGVVTGVINRIRYHEGGFLIAGLSTGDTVVGNMLEPLEGQEYEFHGKWEEHARFGKQFKFQQYTAQLPKSTDGIIRYLVRVAKWVKTTRARKIVDLYGEKTLEVLKNDPERVARDVPGITTKRALEIQEFLKRNAALEAAMVEIENYVGKVRGLPMGLAMELIKRYGSDAVDTVKQDPYVLTRLHRVGFKLADSVALLNGFPRDGLRRKAAAVVHALMEAASGEGHTCLPADEALRRARHLTGVDCDAGRKILMEEERIAQLEDGHLALASLHNDERSIAGIVRAFLDTPLKQSIPVLAEGLAEDQIAAVAALDGHRFGILTGPPGSGKTYLLARYVKGLQAAGFRNVVLCAPTGKAAARMTECLQEVLPGAQAYTIHKTLGPQRDPETDEFEFIYGPGFPLKCDAVVVDETSMLETSLAARLLEATTPEMAVLFIGDHYQLPSVGPGAVLKDLSAAGVPTARLETIKRNAGRIVRACHKIKDGQEFAWSESVDLENLENFRHISKKTGRQIIQTIVRIATEKVPQLGLDPFWDFQALAPMNTRSDVSCKALNDALAAALNPAKDLPGLDFRVGDKVVRLKNAIVPGRYSSKFDRHFDTSYTDEELDLVEVVNGDMGKLMTVEKNRAGKMRVIVHLRNPDRIIYLPKKGHSLQRAFTVTTHRMQGSDAPIIVIPLHKSFGTRITTRNWLYTSISRAKTLCITVGDSRVALDMIKRVATERRTRLVERIGGVI